MMTFSKSLECLQLLCLKRKKSHLLMVTFRKSLECLQLLCLKRKRSYLLMMNLELWMRLRSLLKSLNQQLGKRKEMLL
ncbi:hypothetical protein K438DRAFT_1816322 [Mycena galopus ATCC 62051]|nr:hypothetical protein K438DRAFT_1816322 [Mycena galopus ATCC 62051]